MLTTFAHTHFDVDHFVDGDRVETQGYAPSVQTDYALQFFRASDDEPLCLVVSYGPPHDPYEQIPEVFRDRYESTAILLRPNVEPILPIASDYPEPGAMWALPSSVGTVDLAPYSMVRVTDPRGTYPQNPSRYPPPFLCSRSFNSEIAIRVLYIDSLRPDHLGCDGYSRDTSPNIDRLHETGREEHADRIERTRGFVEGSAVSYRL